MTRDNSACPGSQMILAIGLCAALAACDPAPVAAPLPVSPPPAVAAAPVDQALTAHAAAPTATPAAQPTRIDPPPVPTKALTIVSREDRMVGAPGNQQPGCILTVRFPGVPDDEVATPGRCDALTTKLMTKAEVQALGQLGDVDPYLVNDMDQPVNARMLYIEVGATSQLSFVNGGGIVQTITLAD